jgi:hypothetical protein
MSRYIVKGIILLAITILYSCSGPERKSEAENKRTENKITQQDDGVISLKLEKASCYSDKVNPSCNTAEWNFEVSRPGRYKVWLSSATKDTTDLQYTNSVKVSLLDERLEARPIGDKIVMNATDVEYPYYRVDSYMGSFNFQEPGEYSIQVISEKVVPKEPENAASSQASHTKLVSVILMPITR